MTTLQCKEPRVKEIVEKGLGSAGKLRIIQVLAENTKGITMYAIEQKSGLRHDSTVANLRTLLEIGWVEKIATKPVKYMLNMNDAIVGDVVEFFYKIQYV